MQIDYNNPTDNEIRRIVKNSADPISQIRILAQLTGRKPDEIRAICGGISTPLTFKAKKGRPSLWTEEMIQYLFDHPNESIKDIADRFKLTYSAVSTMRRRLGITRSNLWTNELVAKLTTAYNCGFKPAKISKMLGLDWITPHEVSKKVYSLKQAGKL